jgi:ribonuclease III family protein
MSSPTQPETPDTWFYAPVRNLAFVGDAVYELHVRLKLTSPVEKLANIQKAKIKVVSAEGQAAKMTTFYEELTLKEQGLFKRGRNHKGGSNSPAYKLSTAFEAVIGYHYLSGNHLRVQELLALMDSIH